MGDSAPPQQLIDYLTRMDELLIATNERLEQIAQIQRENQELLQTVAQSTSGGSGGFAPVDDIGASPVESLMMRGGWFYDVDQMFGEVHDGGSNIKFELDEDGPGFVLGAFLIVKGPEGEKTNLTFKTDRWTIDRTIEQVKNISNYASGSNFLPYTPVYSTQNDIYGIAFQNSAGYHFNDDFLVQVDLPNEAQQLEVTVLITKVVVSDMEKFTKIRNVN